MSQENVEVVQRGFEHFSANRRTAVGDPRPGFRVGHVDLPGLAESPIYEGADGSAAVLEGLDVGVRRLQDRARVIDDAADQAVALLQDRAGAPSHGHAGGHVPRDGVHGAGRAPDEDADVRRPA